MSKKKHSPNLGLQILFIVGVILSAPVILFRMIKRVVKKIIEK